MIKTSVRLTFGGTNSVVEKFTVTLNYFLVF